VIIRPLVYIAGPYTHPDPVMNTRAACFAGDELAEMGAAPIVPHLTMLWHTISPQPLDVWYERDIALLAHCHAIVRLPGSSTGADREWREAERIGMPMFAWDDRGRSEINAWIGTWIYDRNGTP
jgi:hypothetical protein